MVSKGYNCIPKEVCTRSLQRNWYVRMQANKVFYGLTKETWIKSWENSGGQERYQHLVRNKHLIYLSHTHPDIRFVVSKVSLIINSLSEKHMEVVHQILGYMNMISRIEQFFEKTDKRNIEVYYDANCTGT